MNPDVSPLVNSLINLLIFRLFSKQKNTFPFSRSAEISLTPLNERNAERYKSFERKILLLFMDIFLVISNLFCFVVINKKDP